MTTTSAPQDLVRFLRDNQRFVLSSHRNPDGDAIGSELALARVLRKLGKSTVIWNMDATPPLLEPLPRSQRIHVGTEIPQGFPEDYDAAILLECPSPDRTGLQDHLSTLPMVNIDHHMGNEQFGKVNWVDTAAPAVGEMVLQLTRALKVPPDTDTATSLFVALVTDTGDFRYPNATARAFDAGADLVRDGAQPAQVAEWLHQNRSTGSLRLLGEMLRTLELHHRGLVATVEITQEMFQRAGAEQGDTEGLINYPRTICGVRAVALFRETKDGRLKVSLRSRGALDVERLSRGEGGGGHKNAAGFTVDEVLSEVKSRVLASLGEILD